jgi:hypothetical protein
MKHIHMYVCGQEFVVISPFSFCLWKRSLDGSIFLVIVSWSFRKIVVRKKCTFVIRIQKGVVSNMIVALCTFFCFPL